MSDSGRPVNEYLDEWIDTATAARWLADLARHKIEADKISFVREHGHTAPLLGTMANRLASLVNQHIQDARK